VTKLWPDTAISPHFRLSRKRYRWTTASDVGGESQCTFSQATSSQGSRHIGHGCRSLNWHRGESGRTRRRPPSNDIVPIIACEDHPQMSIHTGYLLFV